MSSTCTCDPLYRFLEDFLVGLLQDNVTVPDDLKQLLCRHLNEGRHSHSESLQCSIRSSKSTTDTWKSTDDIQLKLAVFIQRGLRSYATNVFRPSLKDYVNLIFLWPFFLELQQIWKERMPPAIEIDLSQSYLKIPKMKTDLIILSGSDAKDKYKSLEISLKTSSVAKAMVQWIAQNFPRRYSNAGCARLDTNSVSIGACESKGPAGKMELKQYRKFLFASFIACGLAKSGCNSDCKKFYSLPESDEFVNTLFVVSKNISGEKLARRIELGDVKVKQEDQGVRDMTVEYLHNLRLQGLKTCRFIERNNDQDDAGMDISWAISAANLATASVNFDLLTKRASSCMEIRGSSRDEKISANSGVLFIMYNYARVVSVLTKFSEMTTKGEYPPLSCVENTDFDLLTSKEEASLVTAVAEWPRVLDRSVDPLQDDFDVPVCLKFMKELVVRFNNFYTSSMVLGQPNAPHNFPKMFARVHLLRACQAVIEEFLDLLQIEHSPRTPFCDNPKPEPNHFQ